MKIKGAKSAGVFAVCALMFLSCSHRAEAADWFQPILRLSRVRITVDKDMVAGGEDLVDFPVYIDLSSLPDGFFEKARDDGGDIRITAADGVSELPREVVSVNRAEKSGEVHFKGTLHHDRDTVFYVYYGNRGLAGHADDAAFGAKNVWTNDYEGVWHKNDFNMTAVKDSRRGNDGAKASAQNPLEVQGKFGYAQEYDGDKAFISAPGTAGFDSFSLSAWLKPGNIGRAVDQNFIYMRAGDSHLRFGIQPAAHRITVRWREGAGGYTGYRLSRTRLADNRWFFITVTYDGEAGVLKGYVNGELEETHENVSVFAQPGGPLDFGYDRINRRYYMGIIDEIRLSSSPRPEGWIKTEYNNQAAPPRFYSAGEEEVSG